MFPVGAVVGALLATRRAQAVPTKARWFGRRYIAQAPPGMHRLIFVVPWTLALFGVFIAASPPAKDGGSAVLGMLLVGLMITPFFLGPAGRHFLFDDESIEVVSAWRRRRTIRYREIVRIRRSLENEGYVVRTSKGARLYIPDHLSGGITLAAKISQHVPESAKLSKAARAKLLASATAEAE